MPVNGAEAAILLERGRSLPLILPPRLIPLHPPPRVLNSLLSFLLLVFLLFPFLPPNVLLFLTLAQPTRGTWGEIEARGWAVRFPADCSFKSNFLRSFASLLINPFHPLRKGVIGSGLNYVSFLLMRILDTFSPEVFNFLQSLRHDVESHCPPFIHLPVTPYYSARSWA